MVRKRKEDFFNYVSGILQNSMLTGIPQIASAGNWPKRIIRTLVFFMCVGGFIYQSLSFMNLYWEYDVVMDVRVENPLYTTRPSFTVCNYMGFKQQEFCKEKEIDPVVKNISKEYRIYCMTLQKLQKSSINLCECLPRLCDENGNLKNWSTINTNGFVDALPRNILEKWLLTPDEIVYACEEIRMKKTGEEYCSDNDDYLLQPGCPYESGVPSACVTYNSMVGRPNYTMEKILSESEIRLNLDPHEENYPENHKYGRIAMSIHSPYTVVNPLSDGFMMEAGSRYSYRLKKVVKKLLPPPYKTNCMDYLSLWRARGGKGPINLRECIQECHLNLSVAKHGCVLGDIYLPSRERRCKFTHKDDDIYAEATQCVESCRPACYEEYYTIEFDGTKDYVQDCSANNHHRSETYRVTFVKIILSGMETTIYEYSPKYQNIETFSYLGGYVGMWLGISLVAVFDFLETVIVMLKYPLRRWAKFKERRMKINQVQKLHRKY